MKTIILKSIVAAGFVTSSFLACSPAADDAASSTNLAATADEAPVETTEVCSGGRFRCYSRLVVRRERSAGPFGLGAKDIADAYKLDTSVDPHATIAIIDAYGYAKAEADLAVYRAQYGLPPCTVANGCLTIVNQKGDTSPLPADPPSNDDWTVETALDLDMASAGCPKCKLLLVQADNDRGEGLVVAQTTAAQLGATVISDSWGFSETADNPVVAFEPYFAVPGQVGIFVASGDSGYNNGGQGPDYPATSAFVTAVGGTRLTRAANGRGWNEVAWSTSIFGGAGGSSCGLSVPKPAWQGTTACNFRAASDVAAVGDPASGPSVYHSGWNAAGGTSAAAPLVAAIYALTGHGRRAPSLAYQHPEAFFDVTSGSNGSCGNVLCKAGAGWDGPTGVGTPNGAALAAVQCTPSCTGKVCGNDGCGGTCGTCPGANDYCTGAGACAPACVPSCTGKTCGDDGCGGSCGDCASGQTCSSAGACQ